MEEKNRFERLLKRLQPIPEQNDLVSDNYSKQDMINEVSEGSTALSPEDVAKILNAESSGGKFLQNPTSSAKGNFQFIDSTRKETLDKLKNDENVEIPANPDRQDALLMKNLIERNEKALLNSKTGPKDVDLENMYLAHHFGAQGALNALNNPKSPISKKRFRKINANLSKTPLTTIDDVQPAKNILDLLKE